MLTFITGNANKAAEVERLPGSALERQALELDELQAIELGRSFVTKLIKLTLSCKRPELVEDTGLSFAAWNGLPER